jgi:uncharacterized ParB-like nuclease family protein
MSNVITANDAQIRTAALQIAIARSGETDPLDVIVNKAKMVELYIKFGTLPNLVKPAKSPTDAT